MVATAMTDDGDLMDYYKLIADGTEPSDAALQLVEMGKHQKSLYCPGCFQLEGKLLNVYFVDAVHKVKHFRHFSGAENRCALHRHGSETDIHFKGKTQIYEWLTRTNPCATVSLEKIVYNTAAPGPYRKPDVSLTQADGSLEAHEIQVSKLTLTEFKERTEALVHLGYQVTWYLFGENFSKPLRRWLRSNDIGCYKLGWDKEIEECFWEEDEEDIFAQSEEDVAFEEGEDCTFLQGYQYKNGGSKGNSQAVEAEQAVITVEVEPEPMEENKKGPFQSGDVVRLMAVGNLYEVTERIPYGENHSDTLAYYRLINLQTKKEAFWMEAQLEKVS